MKVREAAPKAHKKSTAFAHKETCCAAVCN